jgi:hypothetical protein
MCLGSVDPHGVDDNKTSEIYMQIILIIMLMLLISCSRLSNQINPDHLNDPVSAGQSAQIEEVLPINEGRPPESADATVNEDSSVIVEGPKVEPEESMEERDCRRFLAAKNAEATIANKQSMLGRFYTTLEWSDQLVAGELTNRALVKFYDANQQPIPLKLMSFKLFMPSMNHGTIKLDKLVTSQDSKIPNQWLVTQIYFSMGGKKSEWVVDIEAGICGESDKIRVSIEQEVIEPE